RIWGQSVDAVDVRASDRAVDVDLGRMPGDRLDQRRIEIATGLRPRELDDPVGGVRGDPEAEPGEHPPVDALTRAEEIVDRCDEEGEVDHELAHPLAELP